MFPMAKNPRFAKLSSLIRVLAGLWILSHSGAQAGNAAKRLHDHLMRGYNRMIRPVSSEHDAVGVGLGISLQQIIDVNWVDDSMTWDPADYNDIREIRLESHSVWTPDILLYNSLTEKFNSVYHTSIIVSHDGKMKWMPPGIIKSTCSINIRYFPFDVQKCQLKFGSWTYHKLFLNLTLGAIETKDYSKSGEWFLKSVTGKLNKFTYVCCPNEPYLDVTFTIVLQRKVLYYGFNLLIPCLIIAFMVLLDFILPPDCNEKLSLGITIFMSLIVFLLMVGKVTPSTSDSLPLIGIFFVSIMICVSASLVSTICVLNFHYKDPTMNMMPKLIRKVFLIWLPKILLMRSPVDDKVHSFTDEEISLSSRLYDRFGVPNVKVPEWIDDNNNTQRLISQVTAHLRGIDGDLKSMTNEIRRKELEKKLGSEWRFAARVLDRVCLLVFLCLFSAVSFSILLSSPHLGVELGREGETVRQIPTV